MPSRRPFDDDDDEFPIADPTPWAVGSRRQQDRVRICIRVAEARARGMSYARIARKFGLKGPKDAEKCAIQGWSLMPGDDVYTGRRTSAARLDMIMEGLFDTVDDPGPMVNVSGIVRDDDGNPVPDKSNRIAAYRALTEADKNYRQLLGLDAPRRAVSAHIVVGPESIDAEIELKRAELEEEKRRKRLEAARLTAQGIVLHEETALPVAGDS